MKAFDQLIEAHQRVHMPLELGHVIQKAIRAGKTDAERRQRRLRLIGRIFAVFFVMTIMLLIVFDIKPRFSDFNIGNISKMNTGTSIVIHLNKPMPIESLQDFYALKYQERPSTLVVSLHNAHMPLKSADFEAIQQNALVETVYPLITLDDTTSRFVVVFKEPVSFHPQLAENNTVLQIELSAGKVSELSQSKKFRVVTEPLVASENLAILEEALALEYPDVRILPDTAGQFVIEIGQFASEFEARKTKEALAAFMTAKGVSLMIEKMV